MIEYFPHSLRTGPPLSPEVHEVLIQDHMLLCCLCCRVTNIFINHYLNTSPPLKQLSIWAALSATEATKKAAPALRCIKVPHDEETRTADLPLI